MSEAAPRDTFTTRWGFILASAGAAVGLGNLWMFPWRLGEYGGAAFLLPYLLFVYVLGTTGLMGEFAFGRWAGKGAVGAYDRALRGRGLRFGRALGAFPVLTLLGVLIFYSIVTGWVLRYVASSMTGTFLHEGSVEAYFHRFAGRPETVPWQFLAVVLTGAILVFGISRGVERAFKVLMPLMAGLLVVLLIRSLTLPGSAEGIRYILVPHWSYLLKPITWIMALGQAFFSVSLSGSGMVVYGSYLRRDSDIPDAALHTVTLDTLMALMAALTSLLGIGEAVVEGAMDQFGWSRRRCVLVTAVVVFLGGLPLAVDAARFDLFVNFVTVYCVPVGAAMAAVLFFWVVGVKKARAEVNLGARRPVGAWWEPVARYLFVGVAILVIGLSVVFKIG